MRHLESANGKDFERTVAPEIDEGPSPQNMLLLRGDSAVSNVPRKQTSSPASRLWEINQGILDEAEEGIYGLDPKGFVTFMNPAAQRTTGWTLVDFRERTQHSMVHHSHSDGRHYPQEECPIYQALRDGKVHHREN
ncbi:MAG: PAS domain-containing protein [Janthinobacterium lividum]